MNTTTTTTSAARMDARFSLDGRSLSADKNDLIEILDVALEAAAQTLMSLNPKWQDPYTPLLQAVLRIGAIYGEESHQSLTRALVLISARVRELLEGKPSNGFFRHGATYEGGNDRLREIMRYVMKIIGQVLSQVPAPEERILALLELHTINQGRIDNVAGITWQIASEVAELTEVTPYDHPDFTRRLSRAVNYDDYATALAGTYDDQVKLGGRGL